MISNKMRLNFCGYRDYRLLVVGAASQWFYFVLIKLDFKVILYTLCNREKLPVSIILKRVSLISAGTVTAN
jgi:hypothetical protein